MARNNRQPRRNNQHSSVKLLQRPENGLGAFMDASVDAFLLFDENLDLVSINPAGERMFGVSKEMVVGKNIVNLEPDIKKTRKYDKYLDVMKTGEPFFVEEPFSHPKFGDMHLSIKAFKMRKGLGMIVNDITEQRRTGEALRESELLATATIEGMSDGVVLVGMDGKVAYINRAFEKVLGYRAEELVGTSAVELPTYRGSKDKKKAREALKRVIEKGSAEPIDMVALTKDGEGVPISFSASVIKDAQGNPKTLVAVIRDVTERRKAEEALRKQSHDLGERVKELGCIRAISDLGNREYLSLNELFKDIVKVIPAGWQYPEITCARIVMEDQEFKTNNFKLTDWKQASDIVAHGNRVGAVEVYYLNERADEDEGPFLKEERVLINIITERLRRIIERRKAEEAVRSSEEYFRALMENSLDAVTIMNDDGTIRYESPSYERLLGFKPEEKVGSNIFERIHPDDITRVAELFAEFLPNRGGTIHTEVRAQHKDGSWRHIEAIGQNLIDNPIVKGIVVNLRDITERKRVEEALKESEAKLKLYLDNSPDAIYILDAMGNFLYGNIAAEKATGYSREEIVGRNFVELGILSDEQLLKAAQLHELNLAGKPTGPQEYELTRKDGSHVFTEISTYPIGEGEKLEVIGIARDITERRKMEEELRRLSDAVKMTTESVAIADLRGRIVDINEAGLRMYGLENRADLVGKNPFDIIVTEDQPKALENMSRIMETGSVKDIEYYINRKDGKRALIETSVSLIRGKEGEPKGIVAVARDITERRRMEEELRESEERFRAIFDNSVDGILVTDLETKSLYTCNKAMCQMLGYSLEEIRSLKVTDIHPKKDLPYVMTEIERERRGESPGVKVLPLERKDGSVLYAEVTPSLVTFAGRQYLAGIFRDISERKRAEEALKSSEERYRLVVDNANEALVVAQDGVLKFFNSRAIGMLGYSKEEMVSKSFIEFIHPDDQQMVAGRYMARLRGEELPSVYSFRVVDKTGNVRWVEISAVVFTWEGRPATLSFLTDITERKKAEEERQRMEEQLRLAGRLAAVGELAAGVAHELNNPLAAIQGFAQLLAAKDDLDETTKKDLGIVYREAQRAAKITQNLLSFARKHEPEKQLISLNEVIEKTLELGAHRMKVNNIDVVVDFAADLPKTMADFFQMQQVFINIINNAEQAMVGVHRRGRFVVRTQKVGNMIQISFADNGPGIPEENLKMIFDPFFTTKEVGKGTGLGLSICYGLVEAHGGRIYARSKLGQGATVVVEIPIVAES